MKFAARLCWLAVLAVVTVGTTAMAEDTLKLTIGQRGNWENAPPQLGQKAGLLKTHGPSLVLLCVQAKPVATGSPASTFTQTMSGQVDIGWSSPPFGVEALQQGRIRIVVRESDVPAFRNQTVRLMITNTATAEQRRDVIERYLQAYRETLDWMYSDPAALKAYAEWVNIPETLAREVRDQFFPKENLRLEDRKSRRLNSSHTVTSYAVFGLKKKTHAA